MNLIHIQGFLLGVLQMLVLIRPRSPWRPGLQGWITEQERQLRVLLVLFKQVGGRYGFFHLSMLRLAEGMGWLFGGALACAPFVLLRLFLRQADETLTTGLERAGHHISIADWSGWGIETSLNPPKALLELSASRREWIAKQEALGQFL